VVIVARVVTVNDVLDGHVVLDIECLDRIYLNAYVPILQTSSQVVAFLSGHLGFPFPSPALFRQMGDRFRKAVLSFADANDIPWVKFGKDEAKLEVMASRRCAARCTGCRGVRGCRCRSSATPPTAGRTSLARVAQGGGPWVSAAVPGDEVHGL
jgi:hypothetical protein